MPPASSAQSTPRDDEAQCPGQCPAAPTRSCAPEGFPKQQGTSSSRQPSPGPRGETEAREATSHRQAGCPPADSQLFPRWACPGVALPAGLRPQTGSSPSLPSTEHRASSHGRPAPQAAPTSNPHPMQGSLAVGPKAFRASGILGQIPGAPAAPRLAGQRTPAQLP